MNDIAYRLRMQLDKQGFPLVASGSSKPLLDDEWFGYLICHGTTKSILFLLGYADTTVHVRWSVVSTQKAKVIRGDDFVPGVISRIAAVVGTEKHGVLSCQMRTKSDVVRTCLTHMHEAYISILDPSYMNGDYDAYDVKFSSLVERAITGYPPVLAHAKQFMPARAFDSAVRSAMIAWQNELNTIKPKELSVDLLSDDNEDED